jgi:hypothetical protein
MSGGKKEEGKKQGGGEVSKNVNLYHIMVCCSRAMFLILPISTRWQVNFKVHPMALYPNGKTYFTCFRISSPNVNYLKTSMECLSWSRHLTVIVSAF